MCVLGVPIFEHNRPIPDLSSGMYTSARRGHTRLREYPDEKWTIVNDMHLWLVMSRINQVYPHIVSGARILRNHYGIGWAREQSQMKGMTYFQ